MSTATMIVSKDFRIGRTDERLFGSFVEHMGATVYNGIYEPGHDTANENGFRTDVLELVRELGLTVIRYPGGNFVSGFNWEDSIGPVEQRPARLELAWKAIEPNTFGLNEFMQWMLLLPSDPIMTVNLGTRGPDDARNIVEYCNFEKGGYYSDLRREHGIAAPYGIKTWCLGNEMDGPWQIAAKTADEYGRIACEAGKVMKWVDPEIELVAVGSSTSRMSEYPKWDMTVLTHCYDEVDYVALHHYIDRRSAFGEIRNDSSYHFVEKPVYLDTPAYLARTRYVDQQINDIIAACDYVKAVKRSNKTMYLSFDEWNVIAAQKHRETTHEQWQTGSPIDCGAHSMEDALAFASMMMAILRRADRIKIACQSLLVNTGPLVVASKGGASWRNSIFYPFMHMSLFGRGEVLRSVVDTPLYGTDEFECVPVVDDLVIYNEENGQLSVFVVNRSEHPIELSLDLREFEAVRVIDHLVMSHPDLNATNTAEAPNTVVPRSERLTTVSGGTAVSTLPPYSWNVLRLEA